MKKQLSLKCPIYQIYNPMVTNKAYKNYNLDSKLIISAGRLSKEKGFDYLVETAKLVLTKHQDWTWKILGDGEEREFIEKKIIEYGLKDRLILEGNVTNIEEYYRNAAMYVMTSRHEGFGLVLTEAKANQIPCVSFDCDMGPREIILDSINGYLIKCFEIKEMADKISWLIENDSIRLEFSNKALVDTEKYQLEVVIAKWINLFEGITNEGK